MGAEAMLGAGSAEQEAQQPWVSFSLNDSLSQSLCEIDFHPSQF